MMEHFFLAIDSVNAHVINEKAPEFFIGSESIRKTFRHMRRRQRTKI